MSEISSGWQKKNLLANFIPQVPGLMEKLGNKT